MGLLSVIFFILYPMGFPRTSLSNVNSSQVIGSRNPVLKTIMIFIPVHLHCNYRSWGRKVYPFRWYLHTRHIHTERYNYLTVTTSPSSALAQWCSVFPPNAETFHHSNCNLQYHAEVYPHQSTSFGITLPSAVFVAFTTHFLCNIVFAIAASNVYSRFFCQ